MKLPNFKIILFAILMGLIALSIILGIYSAPQKWQMIPLQIAVVDMDKVRENLPAIQTLNAELKKTLRDYYGELSLIEQDLKAEHQALLESQKQKSSPQLSKNLEARKLKFESSFREAQKNVEEKQKFINMRHTAAREKVQHILNKAIQTIAQDYKTALVVSKNNILYSETALDLTDAVLKKAIIDTQHIHMN